MITSSRQWLLSRPGAGDTDGAALEVEANLWTLHFMSKLALPGTDRTVSPQITRTM
jgi:hypothetical protein